MAASSSFSTYLSRAGTIPALIVLCCGVAGSAWGWYQVSASQQDYERNNAGKLARQDSAFVMPPAPPEKAEITDAALDPLALRVWEITARQPLALPPRKEPLTPPTWKIVGVTTIGSEKNVLLLFENQTAADIKKIGDRLPGGAKIVDITQDHLRLLLNGQHLKLSLLKQ
jgi:hypothetical protein